MRDSSADGGRIEGGPGQLGAGAGQGSWVLGRPAAPGGSAARGSRSEGQQERGAGVGGSLPQGAAAT
ncbi:MAG: hypothetical protein WBC31_04705, partial [Candidatus Phosphoribacter baldrii]